MGWESLVEAFDELETKVEYDGYFYSVKDAVAVVTLGGLCELKSILRIWSWATPLIRYRNSWGNTSA